MKRLAMPVLLCAAAAAHARPNILFLFSDDHAAHAISAYGSRINQTPHIDRLAKEGMLFENCFVTNSICAPSRAVILTGLHSHLNGQRTNYETFDGSQTTFPKLLQQAGYRTAMIGKWHLGSDPTGFDDWDVLIGQGPYYNPRMKTPEGIKENSGYTTHVIRDKGLAWLREHGQGEKPWMLMLQHKSPHRNWQPGPDHIGLYEGQTIPEPPDLLEDIWSRNQAGKEQAMSIARDLRAKEDLKIDYTPPGLTEEQQAVWKKFYGPRDSAFRRQNPTGDAMTRYAYQRYIKDYLRTVQSMDDAIGAALDELDRQGLAENTIVIYSSDQGFFLGDYGMYDKRFMYEPSLRAPLMARWPGRIAAGVREKRLTSNLDFAQTFLDLAGAPIPVQMQGASLKPLLLGESPAKWRRSVYYAYSEYPQDHKVLPHRGVRTDRFKLIEWHTVGEWELFDLKTDPREKVNLWGQPQHASLQSQMLRLLRAEQQAAGDVASDSPNG